MEKKTVSVVMCTFNGEAFLREQLDSILQQTRPADEIIIQDDGSTDKTVDIVRDYLSQHSEIRLVCNTTNKGINANFYSAMESAQGDYIVIADQDDIWAADKIERQLAAIGDKMLCIGEDKKFYTGVEDFGNDNRQLNYSLLRMLSCSVAGGHTFMLSRQMLRFLPLMKAFPRTYDVPLQVIAAAYDSLAVVTSPPTQYHRMHSASATYTKQVDNKKTLLNALSYVRQCWKYYRELRPEKELRMREFHALLSQLDAKTKPLADALTMTRLQGSGGLLNFVRLQLFCMKHCDELFYAKERRTLTTFARAAYYPVSCVYYYRYMSKSWKE